MVDTNASASAPLLGAIEAGGTKFIVALARPDGQIIARTRLATTTPTETMGQVVAFLEDAIAAHGPLAAIGVASFGPLDLDRASPGFGTITTTPKPGWAGMRYADWLAPLAPHIAIDTDVNGAALAEWREGAGQGCHTMAYTTVGTGIGTGIVRGGKPLAGFSHYESGHIRVAHDRAADPFAGCCAWHGDCLEGLASGPAIAARFGSSLDRLADPAAAVALVAGYLADLAANLVLLHAPHRLVFGGGVMKAPGLIARLRTETERRLGGYVRNPCLDPGLEHYIASPALGDSAGIVGAIALARMACAIA